MSGLSGGVTRPLPASAPEMDHSGTRVVWTGVNPPIVPNGLEPCPPQNPPCAPAIRGLDGRSLWVFGATNGEDGVAVFRAATEAAAETAGRGAGGGSIGLPWPSNSALLSASISCRSAPFSDLVDPSSPRMASMRRSRSAMSVSRVVIYSNSELARLKKNQGSNLLTLSPDSEVASTDFVAQLTLLFARHLLVFFGRRSPIVRFLIHFIFLN